MFRFLVWIIRWTRGFFAKDQCVVGESFQLWLQTAYTASQFSTLSQLVLCFWPEEPLSVFSGSSCHPLGQIRPGWEFPGHRFLSFSSLQPFIRLFGFIVLVKGSYHRVQSPSFILSFFWGVSQVSLKFSFHSRFLYNSSLLFVPSNHYTRHLAPHGAKLVPRPFLPSLVHMTLGISSEFFLGVAGLG